MGSARTNPSEADGQPGSVFLNIPYDHAFERLYLAYVAAIPFFGLIPRATLELPSSQRRLDKIVSLIRSCDYSLHDLSRVQLDRTPPATPRFNMPFELGIAVAIEAMQPAHRWFVLESRAHRLPKSLSDLAGTDPFIHEGKAGVLLGQLCNIFVHVANRPLVPDMLDAYRKLRLLAPDIKSRVSAGSLFEPRAFHELAVAAKALATIAAEKARER